MKKWNLNKKEEAIIAMRKEMKTIEEVAKAFGVTKERVRQTEQKLKDNLNYMEEAKQGYDERDGAFIKEVSAVINRHSMENNSNTPDFLLAEYLLGCLTVYENTIRALDKWKKHKCPKCGNNTEITEAQAIAANATQGRCFKCAMSETATPNQEAK